MALADPQAFTVGTLQSAPRIPGSSIDGGAFKTGDQQFTLSIAQVYGKRIRREVRLDQKKIVADPLFASQNREVASSVYLVVNHPPQGFSVTELKDLVKGLLGNLTASTDANLIKVLGGEA